ncbi:MAG: ABC transporter ATP-binding protein [Solobacterium sp.]|nr:ABC transporter ATP-binding protein [Solobacterium sp.]MBQ9823716.1 ABC transporter ATP-binding protein [Solobacterium sp.]
MEKKKFETKADLLLYFVKGSKRWFALAVLFACAVSLLELINPKIIGYTVDTLIGDTPSRVSLPVSVLINVCGGEAVLKENLWMVGAAVVFVAVLSALSRFLFRMFNSIGAETLVKRMRDTLFDHITRLPFSWHSVNHTGDIIQRCTSDVEQIKMFLSEQLTSLLRVAVLIAMALFSMYNISPQLMMVSGFFIPVIIGYSFWFHKKIGSQFGIVDSEEGKLSSIAQENLTGVRVVRAFGREKYERSRFEKQNAHYTSMWIRLMQLMSAFWASGDLISYVQLLCVLVFGSYLAVNGSLSAGSFIEFITYNAMLTWPVRMLGRVIANLSKAGISIERLRYIMNSEEEKDLPDSLTPDFHQDITFDHVSYSYTEDGAKILDDVSFTVKAGSTVGILGSTGSGKSTLMYLLDRLYPVEEGNGRILIGDTDIRNIKADWIRRNVGMVLQEPFLFSRTLSENISIASESKDIEHVHKAAEIAQLSEAVDHFKDGYDTFVGERGVTLSGGQKQRTAIAQMLIRKPPVMVFDDSLSAVDAETDAKIRAALNESTKDTTVILIAHRITTLMHADQIIVMDKGRIAEMGSHEELVEKGGIYAKIYDLQMQQSNVGEEDANE